MTEFSDLRDRLASARTDRGAAGADLAVARERLRDVEAEIAALRRLDGPAQRERLAELDKQAATLSTEVDRLRARVGALREDAAGLLAQFTALADPATQLAELDDAVPILLFPVRLETRFHRPSPSIVDVRAGAVAPPAPAQLWIRVYPDDCQIDSFEELLTKTEVDNARAFWTAMWRAGGVEAQERGAWRSLVGGAGSGRATWIVDQYRPDLTTKPAKTDPQDVILVIVPQVEVTPAEQAAAFAYAIAVWTADGDAGQENAALAALRAAVGTARAEELRTGYAPDPAGQDPPSPFTRAEVRVSCAVLTLPATPPTKTTGWTQAPRAVALPDRFVALLFNGGTLVKQVVGGPVPDTLTTGPDPALPPADQIRKDGDDLVLNDDLRWLADFDRAVEVGMGMRVDLTADEATTGFDRLLVVGLRLSTEDTAGKAELETLIAHHYASRRGFGLVPQGSPTNNTEAGATSYSWVDDADAGYDLVFKGVDAYPETADPRLRRDGQWLAEALGVDGAVLKRIPHAAGTDQSEARAMNAALWPATLGYALEEMLTPLVPAADIEATRRFFTRYVSGRGPLPAIRVGRQPYGVLPVTAFSRYRDGAGPVTGVAAGPADSYPQRLHALLTRLDADWRAMAVNASHVGRPGDPHQVLLDVVGLHPGSVEYHQRYAASFEELYNKLLMQFQPPMAALLAQWLRQRSRTLLAQLGADPGAAPPILEKFFYGGSPLLTGPIVDDVPLSETTPVRAYTPDGKNYLAWLATSSLETIRREDFGGDPAPTALLYLLLRHAMMLAQWDAGTRFLERFALVDPAVARREPSFVHVQEAPDAGQSKFAQLYRPQPAVTGDEHLLLVDYLYRPEVRDGAAETADLRDLISALDLLGKVPTARLERVFAEHVDCCAYRLDAWKTGLVAHRLDQMRTGKGDGGTRGIYLGAFGWLENLRPAPATLSTVDLPAELAAVFARTGDAPLRHDPANAGYIHAPSLNHAGAAAILKNAYLVNASPANPDAMAVNLTSDRVRRALAILEGMRTGQSLGALLGYRFERGLHDAHNLAEVDKFIYPLRQAFPLVAQKLQSTKTDDPVDVTLLEARNVLDGLALVNRIRSTGRSAYPFGLPTGTQPGQLPPAVGDEPVALNAEADALVDLYDAVADLVLAESVYQVVLGNFDRAAANTTAFSKGTHPPETLVVDTPRTGLSLTHRVALHLDAGADPAVSPSTVPMTPRARADAPLNRWLADRLPDPADVVVRVTYTSPALAMPKTVTVTQVDLGLQPVDLLYLVNLDLEQAQTELDDRILQVVRYGPDAHPDLAATIGYTEPVPGKVTLLELAALVRSLRALILRSRVVGPADLSMPLEASSTDVDWDDADLTTRVQAAIAALTTRRDAVAALVTDTADLDAYARKVSDELLRTALSGAPQTGTGQLHADIRAIYEAITAKVAGFVTRWDAKDADCQALLDTYPTLTTDEERLALLRRAEGIVSASTTAQPPADLNVYKADVEATKGQFDAHLVTLRGLLHDTGGTVVDFAATAQALAPALAAHDATPFDVTDQQAAITALRATTVARVSALADELTHHIDEATAAATATATASSAPARVERLRAAARLVLGDEAVLVARFRLAPDRASEFANCLGASAALLTDLTAAGRRFPVDDWLYGLARVRDKLGAWENVAVLSEAFGRGRLELVPTQLPFAAGDRWLALEFDPATAGPTSRLLYTAHFATPFDPAGPQCGLLLDEWPELVPGTDVISGLTLHFDRPDSQPPQAMLLAVPPVLTGAWRWDDLVAALTETLDDAKSRAVEPSHVDGSHLAQFLPATLMAVTLYQITIATNLALNNHIYDRIEG